MLGILLAFLAACGWGSAAVLARLGLQHMRSTTGTLISLVTGFAFTTILALIFHLGDIVSLAAMAFMWFFLVGIINFPMGRFFKFTGVQLAGVTRAAPISGTFPLFATILAITIGGEPLRLPIIIGTVAVVTGLGLILSES